MSYLIFVNGLGPDYKGDYIYEFIFTDNLKNIWDDTWESKPCNGYPKPPQTEFIKKVGVLKDISIEFELIQNSDFFSFLDSVDGVIALAWEKENENIDFGSKKRLVFKWGDTEKDVKDKFYERDIILDLDKNLIYEK
jgi:hypothetical protein